MKVVDGWRLSRICPPGCISDGETPEEALRNAVEAEITWLAANKQWGKISAEKPTRLVARLPRSIHRDLQGWANKEGVSINTMMVALIAHGLREITGNRQASGGR